MRTLDSLIRDYGKPDALIDHWDDTSNQYAIWGFESVFFMDNAGCFLDGKQLKGDPLSEWQVVLDQWKSQSIHLAAVGFLSYDLKQYLYPHLSFKKSKTDLPLIWFGKPKRIEAFNIETSIELTHKLDITLIRDIPGIERYEIDLNKIRSYLSSGDIYQINYTHPKYYQLRSDTFETYRQLRNISKPKCGMYINMGSHQILSASPERFFRTTETTIETFPIKGTRKRSDDLVVDQVLANELFHSEKDRAEHLMIVDLLRNDLGKVCQFGSIKTSNLYQIESYETIHHMVTRVHGQLEQNIGESDIIRALFPGGSITGAPKERAMEIIDEVEDYSRGFYTGAIGMIEADGCMDMNIAIRTLCVKDQQAIYPVGGGIVWDSDPQEEWQEAHQKGAIIQKLIKKQLKSKESEIV